MLMAPATATARDYYVDSSSGDDRNEGSQQHPFRTLAPVLVRLTPCDNAYVRIPGAADNTGRGRYSHAEGPNSAVCTQGEHKAS